MTRAVLALALLAVLALPPSAAAQSAVDWRDEAIYFVMTDRFRNGDASNDLDATPGRADGWQGGDLRGVIAELDYIKGLGMTALWLTPVTAQTRGGYHGYWTLDHYSVDPHLGDLDTLKELVRAAHAKGLKVLLDVVLNHVGYDHPWLTDGGHAGWFHPRCEIAFTVPESVERCWLAGLPDLDTENPAVRSFLVEWSLWLARETGADGFRVDTARHLSRDFLREWSAALRREHPRLWILGEVFVDDYREQLPYLEAGLDAVTDFFTYRSIARALAPATDLSWLRLPPPVAESYLGDRAGARATFIDNHDVPRFVGPALPEAATKARLAQALAYLFTAPGTPVLYYGTEVALPGGGDPDNRRAMPPPDARDADLRALVARLASLRQQHPALRRGTWVRLAAEREVFAFARVLEREAVVVAFNGADTPLDLDLALEEIVLAPGSQARAVLDPGRTVVALSGGSLRVSLPPRGVEVVRLAAPAPPGSQFQAPLLAGGLALALAVAALALLGWRRIVTRRP